MRDARNIEEEESGIESSLLKILFSVKKIGIGESGIGIPRQ